MNLVLSSHEVEKEGKKYTLEFRVGYPYRRSHKGKHWPKVTQCLIYLDGLLVSQSEVTKHANDADNQDFANKLAAKKAFATAPVWKELRNEFWKQILK